MPKPRLIIVAVILFIILATLIYGQRASWFGSSSATSTPTATATKTYAHSKFGIEFQYPAGYDISEREVGNGERYHYAVTLIHEKDLPIPENAEGPTAINFDIYQNNLGPQTLIGWFMGSNDSGFKTSNSYSTTTVQGLPAISYSSTGLYERDATAFLHGDNIIVVSATYMTAEDDIRNDRNKILQSLKLTAGTTTPELM